MWWLGSPPLGTDDAEISLPWWKPVGAELSKVPYCQTCSGSEWNSFESFLFPPTEILLALLLLLLLLRSLAEHSEGHPDALFCIDV